MDVSSIIDEIKFELSGGVLELELNDSAFASAISSSLREVQRYINTTAIVTVPYSGCIDVSKYKISAVTAIYRSVGYLTGSETEMGTPIDPMYLAQWQMLSGNGSTYGIQTFSQNYAAWNAALQIRNTVSTDLNYRYDKPTEKLYINCSYDIPPSITIEYIPRFDSIEQITSDYWIDIIHRMTLAKCKIALGRIRTRFTQSNALYTQDGEAMLAEGNEELNSLREMLDTNMTLPYPVD